MGSTLRRFDERMLMNLGSSSDKYFNCKMGDGDEHQKVLYRGKANPMHKKGILKEPIQGLTSVSPAQGPN